MSDIINSTYEIMKELGSGGGGTVYLARHKRLDKLVVLKIDKRESTTDPEILRREVDALKNLNHTYIPQVYDYIVENGNVCTVMDYIEGESLDKPLKEGKHFPQATIIKWACELLEALAYLHSRPPYGILHGDIKPANIMLTPQGDIRLIDFNISLALGEEGAALLGFSPGYASPEHYGFDYRSGVGRERTVLLKPEEDSKKTELLSGKKDSSVRSSSVSATMLKDVLLDKRSDIYSLGATLYHLFSGIKPKPSAHEVDRLSKDVVSEQIADIIAKAMIPNPDLRYQSADEMLYAFKHLHENDKRTIKLKKSLKRMSVISGCIFVLGLAGVLGGTKWKQAEAEEARVIAEQQEEEARLAKAAAEEAEAKEREAKNKAEAAKEEEKQKKEKAEAAEKALEYIKTSEEALLRGDAEQARKSAAFALQLETEHNAAAQRALTKALGVYDVFDGFEPYAAIDAKSEVLKTAFSPDGSRLALMSSGLFEIFDIALGERIKELAADSSALSDIVFLDENRILYAAPGALKAYDLSNDKELWSGEKATAIAISGDRKTVAAIYKDDGFAYVYGAVDGKLIKKLDFEEKHQNVTMTDTFSDPEDNLLELSGDGKWLAVSFSDGALNIYNLKESDMDIGLLDKTSGYKHFEGGFYADYFALGAYGNGSSEAVVLNLKEMAIDVSFPETTSAYRVRAGEYGIYVGYDLTVVQVDLEKGKLNEAAFLSDQVSSFDVSRNYITVVTSKGNVSVFDHYANLIDKYDGESLRSIAKSAGDLLAIGSLDSQTVKFIRRNRNEDAKLAEYDGNIKHSECRLKTDRSGFMLFDYKSFRICDMDGSVKTEINIPDPDQVYDQQYRHSDGDYLEVIYYDGRVIKYSADDGSVISDEYKDKPDASLYEEFYTDKLKITSPLHGNPEIYDKTTGVMIGKIEQDAYLTYVTQTDAGIIMQFIDSNDHQFGLLMDETGKVLADMPNLSDVLPDGTLVFDNMQGILRQSHIYSLNELTKMVSTK